MKLKKIIFVTTLFVLGVTMFNINENHKKPMAITQSQTTSTKFFADDNINEDIKNKYENNWTSLPENMKEYANSVTITHENLSEKFELGLDAKILATTYGNDIYVNDEKYNDHVLIHELFHAYDYSNNWISNQKEFFEIYQVEKDFIKVTDGNVQNVYEFFASAGEMYYFAPNELKNTAPLTYEFFLNHIEF